MLTTDNVMIGNNKFCGRYLNPMDGGGATSDSLCPNRPYIVESQQSQFTNPQLDYVELNINVA